jgi:hypothetical protein
MRDLSATDPLVDDLEALIDEALADPSRAPAVKARIRARLGRAASPSAGGEPHEAALSDAEDLWDNLPL